MGGYGSILLGPEPVYTDAPAGGELGVEIDETSATGYVWQLRADPPSSVEVLEESFAPGSPTAGANGRRRWTLRIRSGPEVRLTAALRRSWESDAPAAKLAVATVRVT